MKNRFTKQIIVGTTALALIGGGGYFLQASNVLAATTDTVQTQKTTTRPNDGHQMGMLGSLREEMITFLKLDKATLQDKLRKGQTLAEIAADQGISRDALKAELITEFNNTLEQKKTKFAANIDHTIDSVQTRGPGGPEGRGEPKGGQRGKNHDGPRPDLTETAKLFGMSAADLQKVLVSGKSLADLATEKGVPVQSVIDLQVTKITKKLDQLLADGKIDQARYDKQKVVSITIATNMVNNKHDRTSKPSSTEFQGGPGGRGGHGGPDGKGIHRGFHDKARLAPPAIQAPSTSTEPTPTATAAS